MFNGLISNRKISDLGLLVEKGEKNEEEEKDVIASPKCSNIQSILLQCTRRSHRKEEKTIET